MASRFILIALALAPFGIGIWIVAAHTVGEAIDPAHATRIGFGVALLTIMAVAYILHAPTEPSMGFGIALLVCGILWLLAAVLFQVYRQFLTPPLHLVSAHAIWFLNASSCIALLVGIWLLWAGVCIALFPYNVNRNGTRSRSGTPDQERSEQTMIRSHSD
jgi:hypothetical protein